MVAPLSARITENVMKANADFRLTLAALLWTLLPLGAIAQDGSEQSAAAPQVIRLAGWEPPPAVVDRGNAVQAEASQLPDHAWAGEYYAGDGLGMNVRLLVSPAAGVSATWHGCLGLYGSNEGLIQPQPDGTLKFAYAKPNEHRFGGFPNAVQPVRWGERRYLIASDELDEFVSAINLGREPRQGMRGMFLLADGDADKAVHGLPDLPEPYRSRIRSEALIVGVSGIALLDTTQHDGWCDVTYRVSLPRGSDDGLGPRAILHVRSPDTYESLRIVSATSHTAHGEMRLSASYCDEIRVPDASWTFTTGAYDPVAHDRAVDAGDRQAEDTK
jgi:hypothetical protein